MKIVSCSKSDKIGGTQARAITYPRGDELKDDIMVEIHSMPQQLKDMLFNLPRLFIDYQLDLTRMKVLDYFFNDLWKIDIHQLLLFLAVIYL